ncbi:MAG: hypothetical protein VYB61_05130 [Verrucomicrobiota bacterium]|jgi:uncharacterized protein YxjI|nr:hypothetical protein [Verrucomicrobiota bacterium]
MKYPLQLNRKIIALSPQIYVTDAEDKPVLYVKQKLLKLKEHVEVFTDDTREKKLCDIKANKVIDWSAAYNFSTDEGKSFGGVRRKGMRSLWRAHYEIYPDDATQPAEFTVREESVLVRFLDNCLSGIPLIGGFTGYFTNPSYIITDSNEKAVMRLKKKPAFLEGKFAIESLAELDSPQQIRILVALLMMTLLEQHRG